jgi:hypothetical protein
MIRFLFPILFLAGIIQFGLTSCAKSEAKPLNPNGDSELALLMRDMHTNGMEVKQQILNGEKPDVKVDCERLFTAKATEPEKVANPLYKGYATAYEDAVKSLENEFNADPIGSYKTMVDACMNCHREVCPGPMVKIKRMYLSEKEIATITRVQE